MLNSKLFKLIKNMIFTNDSNNAIDQDIKDVFHVNIGISENIVYNYFLYKYHVVRYSEVQEYKAYSFNLDNTQKEASKIIAKHINSVISIKSNVDVPQDKIIDVIENLYNGSIILKDIKIVFKIKNNKINKI